MKTDKLFDAIGEARSEYVQDAEREVKRVGTSHAWVKWVAAAACLLVAVLIAVPALSGKTPEAQPEPTDTPVTEPADEPVDEPVDDPADEPANEPLGGPISQPIIIPASSDAQGDSTGAAGEADPSLYSQVCPTYGEFSTFLKDPLYEAVSKSDLARQHQTQYLFRAQETFPETYYTTLTGIYFDSSTRLTSLCVQRFYSETAEVKSFITAAEKDVLTTYEIEGITVQEFSRLDIADPNDELSFFFGGALASGGQSTLRFNIEGEWYYVIGQSTSENKKLLNELVHIAAEAGLTSSDTEDLRGHSVLVSGGRLSIAPAESHVRTGNEPAGLFNPETDVLSTEDRYADIYAGTNRLIGWPYDIAYSLVISNPVLKALLESPETQELEVTSLGAGGYYQHIYMQAADSDPVIIIHDGVYDEKDWRGFVNAENYGIRTDYQVDGVWVEKYSGEDAALHDEDPEDLRMTQEMIKIGYKFNYYARVNVAGGWYQLYGTDEASVDTIATALAHIAAQY